MLRVKHNLNLATLLLALLLNVSCARTQSAYQLSATPDLLVPCRAEFLTEMTEAIDGAEGLNELWLIEFAGRADECRIRLDGLQMWATPN